MPAGHHSDSSITTYSLTEYEKILLYSSISSLMEISQLLFKAIHPTVVQCFDFFWLS